MILAVRVADLRTKTLAYSLVKTIENSPPNKEWQSKPKAKFVWCKFVNWYTSTSNYI